MGKIKLTLQYDGSAYVGWQRQAARHGLSVQQALEDALARLLGQPVTLHGAGRTDSGVHAWAQVAHFCCPVAIPPPQLAPALNHILPADIRVRAAEAAEDSFHARFSATGKRYRYLLAADEPSAFNYRWYWPLKQWPDEEAMRLAAQLLIGKHDFRHFTLSNCNATNFVREVRAIRIYRPGQLELPCHLEQALAIEAEGNGFLYKMVRLLVARLLAVGQGRVPPAAMAEFLSGRPPLNLPPAPAQGLMLMEVYYGNERINAALCDTVMTTS
jgi:tRNA pseudouridine38-40 synthase